MWITCQLQSILKSACIAQPARAYVNFLTVILNPIGMLFDQTYNSTILLAV